MKKILIAVDETKGSRMVLSVFNNLVRPPEEVLLLHVGRLEGKSMMIDMLGEAELETLKESLEETEHMDALKRKSEKILNFYRKEIENGGLVRVRTLSRFGIPSDEIVNVAEEEGAELIITGFNNRSGLDRIVTGCVCKDVERNAKVPVMIARQKSGDKKAPAGVPIGDRLVLKEGF